jgi:tetratricopeptide (TPR) repeat protein
LNIGIVYLDRREYENAFRYFFKSISLNKEEASEIYSRIGPCFTDIGCYGKAEEYLKKAVDLQEGCIAVSSYIYLFLMAGKYEEALHFVDSIKNLINCSDLYNKNLFRIHAALKNFDEAKKYFSDVQPYGGEIILNAYLDKKMGKIDFTKEFYNMENDMILTYQHYGLQNSSFPFALAQINAIKGNNKTAIKYLLEYEKLSGDDIIHAYIENHPIFEDLHGDHDFDAFIERTRNKRRKIEKIAIEVEQKMQS